MRVLCDRHHAGLLYSLQLLFEDRMDLELYVPVGHEWWDAGYWRFGEVFGDDRLAQQYLVPNERWIEPIAVQHHTGLGSGCWATKDPDYPERWIRGVTLQKFRELGDWAYVVSSVQENQHGFHRLAEEIDAVSVYQVGNTRQQIDWGLSQRVLVSAEAQIPDGARAVRYHQEFSKDGLYAFQPERPPGEIVRSFVNCLEMMPLEHDRFLNVESRLPEFVFFSRGHTGRDGGYVQPQTLVAEQMASALFAWHDKPQGDGFGHVIHGWAAVGRPLVGTAAAYAGKMAEIFWEDGVTCIDLGLHGVEGTASLMREIAADPDRWQGMCSAIRQRLEEHVDFDAEFERIAALLA